MPAIYIRKPICDGQGVMRRLRLFARGSSLRLLVLGVAALVVTLAAAPSSSAVRRAEPGSAAGATAAAPCSRATAARLGKPYLWDPFRSQRQQIAQLLCGPFTGPGSTAMVMSFRAPTCWGEQGWAMFRRVGGTWRLVKVQRGTFLFPFIVVDNDIQENAPVFRRGDSRCGPTGGRQGRIWHWNGRRLAQSPISWMLLTTEDRGGGGGGVTSPLPGRISCDMSDGNEDLYHVICGSETLGQMVTMTLDGQITVCTSGCAFGPSIFGMRPPRLPFGQSVTLENFRCTSQTTGVLCTLLASGKGFLINSTGITRVG
jgi:hypothetical protein